MVTDHSAQAGQPVVVGVALGQSPRVVRLAACFASQFGSELICAFANPARFATGESANGSMTSASLDPDFADESEAGFDPRLAADLAGVLAATDVSWRTLAIPGDVAHALGHLANTVDAAMIVVGTRERSLGGGIQDLLSSSVAAKLARGQLRPVVVIPVGAKNAGNVQDRSVE